MDKISYRLVFNRKKKLNAQGKALIQVELYLNKSKVYISTHIYVFPFQWDNKKKEIVSHPQMEELNRMLDEMILKLQWKELELWKKGMPVSLSFFKQSPSDINDDSNLFAGFGRKWVENSMKKESTKKNILTTLDVLEQFAPSASFDDITYNFLQNFECFMQKEKAYGINTIAKHMRHLRSIVNEAIKRNYMSQGSYPFKKYVIKTGASRHTFLLPDELKRIENFELAGKNQKLEHSRDAFLFCCYTGLRYSDFTHLSANNIIRLNGKLWLKFKTVKTGTEVSIPLYLLFNGKAADILYRYRNKLNSFFNLKLNSSVNKDLAGIAGLAKLGKHFSFHTARHTNATLLIYLGAQITTVQKLLGHRNVKTTQGYGEIFSGTIVNDLKKCKF